MSFWDAEAHASPLASHNAMGVSPDRCWVQSPHDLHRQVEAKTQHAAETDPRNNLQARDRGRAAVDQETGGGLIGVGRRARY